DHPDLHSFPTRRSSDLALFALIHVILQLQADRVTALVAEVRRVRVVGAALGAEHVTGVKGIGDHGIAAVLASSAEVMQALKVIRSEEHTSELQSPCNLV